MAWQDIYINGIVYVPVHPTLPEQDLVLRRGGCLGKGLTKGAIQRQAGRTLDIGKVRISWEEQIQRLTHSRVRTGGVILTLYGAPDSGVIGP